MRYQRQLREVRARDIAQVHLQGSPAVKGKDGAFQEAEMEVGGQLHPVHLQRVAVHGDIDHVVGHRGRQGDPAAVGIPPGRDPGDLLVSRAIHRRGEGAAPERWEAVGIGAGRHIVIDVAPPEEPVGIRGATLGEHLHEAVRRAIDDGVVAGHRGARQHGRRRTSWAIPGTRPGVRIPPAREGSIS